MLWKGWILAASGAAVIGIAAAGAVASNFGSTGNAGVWGTTNSVNLQPDRNMGVAKRVLAGQYSAAVNSVMASEYNPTDLNTTVYSNTTSCSASLGHNTCVFDYHYGNNGFNGWNACLGPTTGSHPNRRCTVQYARINLTYLPPPNHIVCHEVGHSTGLRHTYLQSSCMKSGGNASVLNAHDKAHLNAKY